MREHSDVLIVGGGASGCLCGGLLSQRGFSVTILEKNLKPMKKLLATGNGRCNFTNQKMSPLCFYGDGEWIRQVLEDNGPEDIVEAFEKIGVLSRDRDGYVYPYTNQAVTLVEALENFSRDCQMVLDAKVGKIYATDEGYEIRSTQGIFYSKYLIVATGGAASPELGGDHSGYRLLKQLDHRVTKLYPGLTGLKVKEDYWDQVAGTRIQGKFSLDCQGEILEGEIGEIQIVKNGISGIPVFQLARRAAEALAYGQEVYARIDFVPAMTDKEVAQWLLRFSVKGLVPKKWEPVIAGRKKPVQALKRLRIPVRGTFGMDRAQVTAGGVSLREVSPVTMESCLRENLYILGEALDVDGLCGGYNLHMAWSTARRAAWAISDKENKKC
ncbi:MAG: aminoacetone oxidase family FAD-binding enzyme [Eubacterium sp.]|nr:aminoacetone oxidase family FAD-binding enzyme [Eubacterium sp.]